MEEGVVNELLSGSLRDVFDHQQMLTDVSGCGNNWYVLHSVLVHISLSIAVIFSVEVAATCQSFMTRALFTPFQSSHMCNTHVYGIDCWGFQPLM